MTERKTMLVIGATGVIGRRLIETLEPMEDWDIVGVSRRAPGFATRARHISVDLSDRDDCIAKLGGLSGVTHMMFAAYIDRPTWAEQCAPNAALIENTFDGFEPASENLRHVTLMQGTKYYGCHLGPFKTPAKESDPRHMPPNFYFNQEDALRVRQQGKPWKWTLLRPHTVCGFAPGMPLNLIAVIAVYAAISKELGLPLRFPGTEGGYRSVFQVTDADLLSRSILWAATEPKAGNEAFNITNGDYFRWETLWPQFAEAFGMDYAPPAPIRLGEFMADKGPLWDGMVGKYGLMKLRMEEAANWAFGDYIFNQDWDIMSDTLKARQAGFPDCVASDAMFLRLFDEVRERRFVP